MNASKSEIISHCLKLQNDSISRLSSEIHELSQSAASDTKSSMGDKYETSREMINLEKGKLAQQLEEAQKMKRLLMSIDLDKNYEVVESGALITTSKFNFLLCVSLGKVEIQGETIFAISPVTPIGQQLLGSNVGTELTLMGQQCQVLKIQ